MILSRQISASCWSWVSLLIEILRNNAKKYFGTIFLSDNLKACFVYERHVHMPLINRKREQESSTHRWWSGKYHFFHTRCHRKWVPVSVLRCSYNGFTSLFIVVLVLLSFNSIFAVRDRHTFLLYNRQEQ